MTNPMRRGPGARSVPMPALTRQEFLIAAGIVVIATGVTYASVLLSVRGAAEATAWIALLAVHGGGVFGLVLLYHRAAELEGDVPAGVFAFHKAVVEPALPILFGLFLVMAPARVLEVDAIVLAFLFLLAGGLSSAMFLMPACLPLARRIARMRAGRDG